MRPTKNEAKIGIVQCKDAIMNGLGKYSKQVFWQKRFKKWREKISGTTHVI